MQTVSENIHIFKFFLRLVFVWIRMCAVRLFLTLGNIYLNSSGIRFLFLFESACVDSGNSSGNSMQPLLSIVTPRGFTLDGTVSPLCESEYLRFRTSSVLRPINSLRQWASFPVSLLQLRELMRVKVISDYECRTLRHNWLFQITSAHPL